MIRRGEEIRVGPVRILIGVVRDETCEVVVGFESTRLGSNTSVPVSAVEELKHDVSEHKRQEARDYMEKVM